MKTAFIFITVLFLFFGVQILNAQTWTIATCSGIPSSVAVTNHGPMYTPGLMASSSRVAVIYPAAQLGGIVGQTLTTIYYHRASLTGTVGGSPNFKVYLKETTAVDWGNGNLSWQSAIGGATLVYDGNPVSSIGSTSGWKNFPFNSATFNYSGAQNLAILMEYSNANNTSFPYLVTWSNEVTSPCVDIANPNTTKCNWLTQGTLSGTLDDPMVTYKRPYIGFDYGTSSLCAVPSTVTSSNLTASTADISWSAVAQSVGYEYAVTASATPPASGTFTLLLNYLASGFSPATTYYAHVRTKCNSNSFSAWKSISFSTPGACNPPSNMNVGSITGTTANISWGAVSGAGGYEYAVTTSSVPPLSGAPSSSTTYTATGLTAATAYYAHVRTKCNSGTFSLWKSTPFNTTVTAVNNPDRQPRIFMHPNPATSFITIEGLEEGMNITMTDLTGRIICHRVAESQPLIIEVHHLSAGHYLVNIKGKEMSETMKFRKM